MNFQPSANIETLRARAELNSHLREFFESEGFWEVETPLWSRDTCIDTWIDPVACTIDGFGQGFLQTSPEFHMKRLLASGADAIWALTKSFRGGEVGDRHNPEFSIIEWYKTGETHEHAMDRTERLIRMVAKVSRLELRDAPFIRLDYYEAFERVLGVHVDEMSAAELQQLARHFAPKVTGPFDRDGWLNALLSEAVEPWLSTQGAVFLTNYPASQAALATIRSGTPPVAERFELYLDGIELANGYHELTDAEELRIRFEQHNQKRAEQQLVALPVESQLLSAMTYGLPACAGVAVGWDRLVMLALGLSSIRDVIAFPIDRA